MKHLDLFSGIGGFALAAKWAAFETVQFVEKDPFCQKVLAKHWPNVPIHDDIKTFSYAGEIKLLTGGFPCQPFSVAGKKKGISDDRYLWPEMLRIISDVKPAWVIGENVTGIVGMELDKILNDLGNQDYQTTAFIIPACAAGAPHRRERVWIIAHAYCERRNDGIYFDRQRTAFDNFNRNLTKNQKRWSELQYESWKTFNTKDWLGFTTNTAGFQGGSSNYTISSEESEQRTLFAGKDCGIEASFKAQENQPPIPGVDDGISNIVDRNRALGNAIVPQVVYPIMKFIYEIEQGDTNK